MGEYGFGTPKMVHAIYIAKLVLLHICGGVLVATSTSGVGPFWHVSAWWSEPIIYEKFVLWTVLLEMLGLAGSWGPMAAHFKPMTGGFRYWARPDTIRLAPWPGKVPFTSGDRRTAGDVGLYLGIVATLVTALVLPSVSSGPLNRMNLTEPDAGSDLGAVRTKATPAGGGTWRVTGQTIFITYGEHDMADNIIHLVLARVPDAPAGTRGISCFVVPKTLVSPDGALGERNRVSCVSIEAKLGIHASPTCVLDFDGAEGYLIGEPNEGMRYMFTMMNNVRLFVGIQGLAIASRVYQQSAAYAKQRHQGRRPGAAPGRPSAIIDHPDVRRMLLTQKASIEALRSLIYLVAESIDIAEHHPGDV